MSGYRTKGTHYGQEWTILVTYNRETAKKQRLIKKDEERTARLSVEEMDDDAKAVYGALRMSEFLPKSGN